MKTVLYVCSAVYFKLFLGWCNAIPIFIGEGKFDDLSNNVLWFSLLQSLLFNEIYIVSSFMDGSILLLLEMLIIKYN